MTNRKPKAMTVPDYHAEVEFLLRSLRELAGHPDERVDDLAHRANYAIEHRPRGA
jgi:hypothetical protein